ncbi:MAG: helix-turn-helix domain-containing protein, partial [Pseudomonadota bacterium]|nr:helix-turn-helix domain-containing protein [Pseudomonadota bacterium]
MNDDTNITATAPPSENLGRSSPGEYLRKLREEKGHTHATVSSALHLTVHYIKALEGDEYGKLPGLTFVKGYLRSYARFLGADVNTVLARFDEHIAGLLDAGQHTARVERSKRRQDQALRWAIGAGLVAVAGIAAGWWFMRDAQPSDNAVPQGAAAAASQQVVDTVSTQPRAATPPPPVAAFTAPAGVSPAADTGLSASTTTLVSEENEFGNTLVPEENEFGSALVPKEHELGNTLVPEESEFGNTPVPEENEFGSTPVPEQGEFSATLVTEENEFGSTPTSGHSEAAPVSGTNAAAPSAASSAPDTSAPA